MTTVLVADPRHAFQERIEQAVEDCGFTTIGSSEAVLTPDMMTAKVRSGRNVPVVLYDYEDTVDVAGLMGTVTALGDASSSAQRKD